MEKTQELVTNRLFKDIAVGETADLTEILTRDDADLLGGWRPDGAGVEADAVSQSVASMWIGILVMRLVSTCFPGVGSVVRGYALTLEGGGLAVGDRVVVTCQVVGKHDTDPLLDLTFVCVRQDGGEVARGTMRIQAPEAPQSVVMACSSFEHIVTRRRFRALCEKAAALPVLPVAVAYPCDDLSLRSACDAARRGLARPILVGPRALIESVAGESGLSIDGLEIVEAADPAAASAQAVALVRAGRARMLMKGAVHTDVLLHEVVARQTGLCAERRLSHVFVMDVPFHDRLLMISDAVVNIAPDVRAKHDIVQNVIDFAHVLGLAEPRVAVLSAVETVNPAIQSTLDAAVLSKMADRGQITGGIVDGPLAFDNAVNRNAAKVKHIDSPVAGRADIVIVPTLEAGNMLAKELSFLAGADAAGVVLGARVPVILTSRADSEQARLTSCAIALIMAHGAAA
ncbi:bifunctional enoyl-CoA hydratase/phosphate acetyltransferase [Gluconacetobacter sacchari]|uniref:bifunctional enoyl-CoA hydratase/phosphate acetyltransferase n=1 Tax=Gluconacetobacter sacchari TaxID=92759 RepID=UPI002230898A|nr:bifunctional enoyl-CoA hydratase/phosphate acetyltransferase [Gluconacetobacter sacchari]